MDHFKTIYGNESLEKQVGELSAAYGYSLSNVELTKQLGQHDRDAKLLCLSADNAKREALH